MSAKWQTLIKMCFQLKDNEDDHQPSFFETFVHKKCKTFSFFFLQLKVVSCVHHHVYVH